MDNSIEQSALWERLIALESQLAYQEYTIEALNQVIAKLSEQLSLQQEQLRYLYEQQQQQTGIMRGSLREEIPPHY
ncbi:MAG: SlyX family protein [Cardiobacteriaceae bacterium]|nr:SlyX family protein [Cardiobacteriaceae bacterium]